MEIINTAASVIKNIRIQDILDMAIIAGMIFALLMWFKTRASRFVLIGILLLGGVYLAARFFQLYLTVIVLQGFFAILLFVLVVIFQEDLRGFFERIAMLGQLGKPAPPLSRLEKTANIIAETAGNLAKRRVGALMVIQGNDPLDRHLTGGVPLNGAVSEPLLESLFDPHSPGHDGAVVIKDDRVTMFGCHLPLSVHTARNGNMGLRHTAALGLTERSDALCVVVSEERGSLSVSEGEALLAVSGPSTLHEILEKYYAKHRPAPQKRPVWAWLSENTKEKLIAVGLAFVLWAAFGYQRDTVRRDFFVPLEYKNMPAGWQFNEPPVKEAKVTLQGPDQAFRLMNEDSLKLSLDLSALAQKKLEFPLNRDMVNTPPGLSIAEISPAKIRVSASRQVAAQLPVSVGVVNRLPDDLVLQKITVKPATLKVMLDSRMKPGGIRLETEPLDLRNITSSETLFLKVNSLPGVSFPDGKPAMVRVSVRVGKR
ncbi:MAG TPA: diadenylate cyclase [Smithellaceae bacterium]|nr:diadenylate cyclase [Smithellaceae bacterium]HRV45913.1 diadenylate cyclase [Smithellaceae bacterium]